MVSDRLMELFRSATHHGTLESATHTGRAGVPGHGPHVGLQLRVEEGTVRAARFECHGCPAAIACGEALCRVAERRALAALQKHVTAEMIRRMVGGVPEGKEHCPELAAGALRQVQPAGTGFIVHGAGDAESRRQ